MASDTQRQEVAGSVWATVAAINNVVGVEVVAALAVPALPLVTLEDAPHQTLVVGVV
jgi:hypothetical protein